MTLQVRNQLGAHADRSDTGMGLSGLAHRVTAIDGTFDAGPERDHWVVRASLPNPVPGLPA